MAVAQNLFNGKNLTAEEIKSNLEALSFNEEIMTFPKKFTPEENIYNKNKYFEVLNQKNLVADEFKEISDDYKAKLKSMDNQLRALNLHVKNESYDVHEKVYLIQDFENNMMCYYDQNANLISARPLMSNERQISIPMHVNKLAANS